MKILFTILLLAVASPVWADTAWFIADYVRIPTPTGRTGVSRACAVGEFNTQIKAEGGTWWAIEVLGNKCLVKVKASASMIATIAGTYQKIPATLLNDPLSSLTVNQRNAIKQVILDAGYSIAEVNARFPNLANNTLGDALRFLATRRLRPRYDQATDTIILDGQVETPESVDVLDGAVQ